MKRKIAAIIALLLAALMLSSCAIVSPVTALANYAFEQSGSQSSAEEEAPEEEPEPVPFSEMIYERPDLDYIEEQLTVAIEAVEKKKPYSRISELITTCVEIYYDFSTATTLADIHSCLDRTNEYWAEEYNFCLENSSTVEQLFDDLYYACAASRHGKKMEEDFFWEGFCEDYKNPEDSDYSDEAVALMQQEAGLLSEYHSAIAAPIVTVDGVEYDYYEYLNSVDNENYASAFMSYYYQYNEELADIYIKLVKLRRELAEVQGYDSYRTSCYEDFRRDYTPEDAEQFIRDVRRYAVPLFGRVELYSTSYIVSDEDNKLIVGNAAEAIGGDIGETFTYLNDYGLLDISYSDKKADMSFTAYLDNYNTPFLFLDPMGYEMDLSTLSHELGHAVDMRYNEDALESIDLAEVFSQSLELMMPGYMEELHEDVVDDLYRMLMSSALTSFVEQCSLAEFENRVYAMSDDELTVENLNALALQLSKDYGYYVPGAEDYFSMYWMDVVHLFEYPFYVISYPVSLTVALEIYELELREPGAGIEQYYALLPRDAIGVVEAAEDAGLESPFAPGRVEQTMKLIEEKLK